MRQWGAFFIPRQRYICAISEANCTDEQSGTREKKQPERKAKRIAQMRKSE